MEIIDHSLHEIGEQLLNLIRNQNANQGLTLIQLMDKLCNKINLMTFDLKIRIKLDAIRNKMNEFRYHSQSQDIRQIENMYNLLLEFTRILCPKLIYFDCFSVILENVLKRKNKTIVGSNTLIWSKNLFYLIYFVTNNNEELVKLSELLIECINEIKNEYEDDIIFPSLDTQNPQDHNKIYIYHFLEECAMRIFRLKNLDYFCGKAEKYYCFFPRDLLEKKIHKKALTKDFIAVRFFNIYKKWNSESSSVKDLPNLFTDRTLSTINEWAPKKSLPFYEINVNQLDNGRLILDLFGDFSAIEGESCEIRLIKDRIIFFKVTVERVMDKNKIDVNIPSTIFDASYLVVIETPFHSSNPVQYDHHPSYPNSPKIKLNKCYVDCCYPIYNKNITGYSPLLLSQKDFKLRNTLMVACLNGSWENLYSILKSTNINQVNLNDIDEDGNTCLHFASYNGCFEIVKELISLGANPNVLNRYGECPLFFAQRHDAIFEFLSERTSPVTPSISFWESRDGAFLTKWTEEKKFNFNRFDSVVPNPNDMPNPTDIDYDYFGEIDDYSHTGSMDPSMDNGLNSGSMMDPESENSFGYPPSKNFGGPTSEGNYSYLDNNFFGHHINPKPFISYRQSNFSSNTPSQIQTNSSQVGSVNSGNSVGSSNSNSVRSNNTNNTNIPNDSSSSKVPQSDCFVIYDEVRNGNFKVNWIPPPVSAYLRWAKPVPQVKYHLPQYNDCYVEVMLMDSSSNEVVINKRKNFFFQHKKTQTASCIFPLSPKENTQKLKFGFNVTTNMHYQKVGNETDSGSEEISSKKRKLQNQGKFKLHFILWETRGHKNKLDWIKLAVWSSSMFNLVSHSDQINQNKNSTSPNPECLFPFQVPENTSFPVTIVGTFPSNLPSYTVVFREQDGTQKIIQLNQQNSKMLVGSTPLLKAGAVTVYVIEKDAYFPQNGLSLTVMSYSEWKKTTGFQN